MPPAESIGVAGSDARTPHMTTPTLSDATRLSDLWRESRRRVDEALDQFLPPATR